MHISFAVIFTAFLTAVNASLQIVGLPWQCMLGKLTLCDIRQVSGGSWTSPSTWEHLQAHGAGVIKVGSTFYLIGENKLEGSPFQSIRCYSSQNLVDWTFAESLLTRQASGDLGPVRVVERPKVIYNDKTGQYVMYLHIDNSSCSEAKVGVATSSSVCGTYSYRWVAFFQTETIGLYIYN